MCEDYNTLSPRLDCNDLETNNSIEKISAHNENNKQKAYFYEDSFIPTTHNTSHILCDLSSPQSIFSFLDTKVYKQTEWKRTASIILYEHLQGKRGSVNLVYGPPGTGKTLVAQTLRNIYNDIIIWDTGTMSKEGWSGNNKLSDLLMRASEMEAPLIFLDEFDKICQSAHNSANENVNAGLQTDFLSAMTGAAEIKIGRSNSGTIRTDKITWILSGSFAAKATEISERKSSCGFGFEAEKNSFKPYQEKLSINDLIEFGMLPEIASRITRMVALENLTYDDYLYLLTKHPASPLLQLQQEYEIYLNLSPKEIQQIATSSYENNLGLRHCRFHIQKLIDEQIFNSFKENTSDNPSIM